MANCCQKVKGNKTNQRPKLQLQQHTHKREGEGEKANVSDVIIIDTNIPVNEWDE